MKPLVRILSLFLTLSSLRAMLPVSPDIPVGPAGIELTGGAAFPGFGAKAAAGAPAIAAITEITFPGETLSITGEGLDGANLRLWTDGALLDVTPLRTDAQRMQAVIPTEANAKPLAPGTLVVWPVKGENVGAPIRVNAPSIWWTWPARVPADGSEPLRVMGKNLTMKDAQPLVVLTGAGLGGRPRRLEVAEAKSYQLRLHLPADLPPGTYQVHAHNGTGHSAGWSHAASIEIVAPSRDPAHRIRLKAANREDITEKLRAAFAEAAGKGGAIVELPEGTFECNGPIASPAGVPVVLRGAGMGRRPPAEFGLGRSMQQTQLPGGTILFDHLSKSGETAFIELRGAGSRIEDITFALRSVAALRAVRLRGPEQRVRRARFVCQSPYVLGSSLIECRSDGAAGQVIEDCEFILMACAIRTEATDQVRISRCRFFGMYLAGRGTEANAIRCDGSSEMIVEDCAFRSVDRTHGKVLGRSVLFIPHNIRNILVTGNRSEDVGSHSSVAGMDGNVSEQYLFHGGGTLADLTKQATQSIVSATANRVVLANPGVLQLLADKARAVQERQAKQRILIFSAPFPQGGEWTVFIARGRGVGQWRVVTAAQPDGTLTLDRPWRIVPDATSAVVLDTANRQIAICDNLINPAPDPAVIEPYHKTIGIYYYYNTFDTLTAGNTLKNIGSGIGIATKPGCPCAWNTVRENTLENVTGSSGGTSLSPMFYNEHDRGIAQELAKLEVWNGIGNVFRANRGTGADAAALIGWLRFNINDDRYTVRPESGLTLSVIEHNEFLDVARGILVSAPSNWTLLRQNRITPRGATPALELYRPEKILGLLEIK